MEPHETPEANQASGTSIFWALIALALNAMTEPSRAGSLFFRPQDSPGTATHSYPDFDPLRSSPVLCAAETVLDILFFIVEPKPQTSETNTTPVQIAFNATDDHPTAAGVLQDPVMAKADHPKTSTGSTPSYRTILKVIAFFLGVLPQAIKLFSMRGIVGTQICATMFLAASVARAIGCPSSSHFSTSIASLKSSTYRATGVTLLLFTYIAHLVIYLWLYFNIAAGLFFDDAAVRGASNGSGRNVIYLELAIYARSAYMMFGMITMFVGLVRGRPLPPSQWFPLCMLLVLQDRDAPKQHTKPGTWIVPPPTWLKNCGRAIALITMSLMGCIQVSALCIASGRVLSRLAAERAARSDGLSDESRPPIPTVADNAGWISRFHVIETLWQGMVWLKAVFLGLREQFDNDEEWLGTWHEGFGASIEQLGLAVGIFNLLTALLYYLVVFDSTRTSSPSWTSALG